MTGTWKPVRRRARRRRVRLAALAVLLLGPLAVADTARGADAPVSAIAPAAFEQRAQAEGGTGGGEAGDEDDEGALRFVEQPPWHVGDAATRLRLRVLTEHDPAGLELAAAVYPRLTSRSEFQQTLAGRIRRSAVRVFPFPLAELVPDATGVVTIEFQPPLRSQGVYPLRVELRERDGGDVLGEILTHIVHLPAPPDEGEPLRVALVAPVHARPATQPDGSTRLPPATAERLDATVGALVARPSVPLTVLPTPETMDALVERQETTGTGVVDRLRAATAGRQVLAQHYVRTDLPTLLRARLDREIGAQAARARGTLVDILARSGDAATWVDEAGLDEASLAHLDRTGVSRVVLPEEHLEPVRLTVTLAHTFAVPGADDTLRAAAADTGLAAHLDAGSTNPALAAHHLLADLAVIYFDRPGAGGRGVVVVPPDPDSLPSELLTPLLQGLATSPVLEAVTLDGFFATVDPLERRGVPVIRQPIDDSGPPLAGSPVRATRERLSSFLSMLEPGNPLAARLDRTLLTSLAAELRPAERDRYLAGVRTQISGELEGVHMPARRSITLTAREGEIPVTVSSDLAYPIQAVLRFSSQALSFPGGEATAVTLRRSNHTERVAVETNTSGSFPLRVQLVSPDGGIVISETLVTVRSTAVSGVGVGLSVGAAVFLLVWWGRHLHGRRSKRLVPT